MLPACCGTAPCRFTAAIHVHLGIFFLGLQKKRVRRGMGSMEHMGDFRHRIHVHLSSALFFLLSSFGLFFS